MRLHAYAASMLLAASFFLLVLLARESCGKTATAPGPFAFSVSIPAASSRNIRRWMKNGGKTRINLGLKYSPALGLPAQALDCGLPPNLGASSYDYRPSNASDAAYMQFILDWCRWEWNFKVKL